jgi:hypothetical protein
MASFLFILSSALFLISIYYAIKNSSWLFSLIALCTGIGLGLFVLDPRLLFVHSLALIVIGIGSFLLLSFFYADNTRLKWTRVTLLILALAPFLFKLANWPGAPLLLWSFIPCMLLFVFLFLERRKIDEQPFYELALCFMIMGFCFLN